MLQLLDADIAHWLALDQKLPEVIDSLTAMRDEASKAHREGEVNLAKSRSSATVDEITQTTLQVKALHQKYTSLTQRVECVSNQRWWLSQSLRSNYRRRCILKGLL